MASTKAKKSNQNRLILIAAIVVVIVAIGVLVASSASAPAPQVASAGTVVTSGLISPQQYTSQFVQTSAPHQLVDVRTPEEFASGHLPGAVNIPLQDIPARLGEFATDQPVVLYCHSGNRSNQAAGILNSAGFTQVLDLGGIMAWEAAGLPVVQ